MTATADDIINLVTTVDTTVDINESDLTPIQEFYNNSNVLITGCTGFLGYALLEKLLRSCPVSKIFILIRNKKGKSIKERLDEMFRDPLFQRINTQFPERRNKVVPVEGDITLSGLGICDQDRKLITDEVNIVFHMAATIRFDEKLNVAVNMNLRAPIELVRFARQMYRLKSFMHVSTVYSNCIHKVIEEQVYPPAVSYENVMSLVDTVAAEALDRITPRLLGKYPNTYIYTKQIAEDAVKREGRGLPVGIHRPAIVISTYKEPIRGWTNQLFGLTGCLVAIALGVMKVGYCNKDYNVNIVPVDMCVNSLITAAWDVAETFKKTGVGISEYEPIVYNFASCNKAIRWEEFMKYGQKYGYIFPSTKCVWYATLIFEKNYLMFSILWFLLHTIPAVIADGVLLCIGKPVMALKGYKKLKKLMDIASFFDVNEWTINSSNVTKVVQKMGERDRRIFLSDLNELDWDEYFKCYVLGGRTYLLKESLHTLPEAHTKYRKLYWAHQGFKAILGILVLWAAWAFISTIFFR